MVVAKQLVIVGHLPVTQAVTAVASRLSSHREIRSMTCQKNGVLSQD
jgi:hypothetical protein